MSIGNEDRKLILICVDGADPEILYSMIHNSEFPSLKTIMNNGVHGYLTSLAPPISPAVWISLATGLSPLDHGVFDFIQIYMSKRLPRIVMHTSRALQGISIWDYISMAGLRSVVINYPFTYPSYPINGIMVSGFPSPTNLPDITPKITLPQDIITKYCTEFIPTISHVENYNDAVSIVTESS